jgi:K+-transporting ATPase KdpF subunit
MNAFILLVTSHSVETYPLTGYVIGAVVAVFLFGYLFYSLNNPEKF